MVFEHRYHLIFIAVYIFLFNLLLCTVFLNTSPLHICTVAAPDISSCRGTTISNGAHLMTQETAIGHANRAFFSRAFSNPCFWFQ